jgi:FtsH-binding integral membrane protein
MYEDPDVILGEFIEVYGLFFAQLIFTILLQGVNMFVPQIYDFNQEYWWATVFFLAISFGILCNGFVCCATIRFLNFVVVFLFTLTFGWFIGMLSSFFEIGIILISLIITFLLTITLTIYVHVGNADFSTWLSCWCSFFIGIVLILVLMPLATVSVVMWDFYFFQKLTSILAFSLFAIMFAFDTSNVRYRFHESEKVFASVTLYLDICCILISLILISWK